MRVPIKGDKVYLKNNPLYSRQSGSKPCKVEDYILGIVFVRPLRLRLLLEVMPEDLDYLDDEKLTMADKEEILKRLVKEEFLKTNQDWMRELNGLNKIYLKYPYVDFLRNLTFDYQARSIWWFLGGGADQLTQKFKLFSIDISSKKQDTQLNKEKLGEDVVIKQKFDITKI